MNRDVTNLSVLVTGGTRGIGRAIVEAFVKSGARVSFTYHSSRRKADTIVKELSHGDHAVKAYQGDVGNPPSAQEIVDSVVADQGGIDVLVNNAGIARDGLMLRLKTDDWDAVLETNLKGVFNFCKASYRPMMKQRSGRIINISSVVGVMGNAGQTNYSASKAGVIGLSKSLARELGGRGITVNVIAPGYVTTDMTENLSESAKNAMLEAVPLGRAATPKEVASAALFLASRDAGYITGHVLHVDGGLAM